MSEQHNYSAIKKENLSWFQRLVFRNVVWKRSESPVPYPGRRFLARVLDWTIYYLIWTFINMVPLRGKIIRGLLLLYADSMVVMLIMLILEPLMLSLFGTTPGKAVMGLVLRTDDGEKLPLRDSFRRTFQVFADGMGLNVIILNLLNMSWARRNCAEGKALLWEQENSYVIKDTALWRQIAVIAASLFLVTTAMPQIYNLAQYPLHRGNITPENYVENVNEMLYRSGSDTGFWLDDEGFWRDEDGDLIESVAYTPPQHEIIYHNGLVAGVRLRIRISSAGRINGALDQKALVAAAFAASIPDVDMDALSELSSLIGNIQGDYEATIKGINIKNTVSYSGYRTDGEYLYGEEDAEDRYYECDFEMILEDYQMRAADSYRDILLQS